MNAPSGFPIPIEDAGVGTFDPAKHMSVRHHFVGGIYTKEMRLPVGRWFGQHRHSFDHQSILVSGRAIVEVDGERSEYEGPAILNIKARRFHTIIPLTPVVWLCQHVTGCTDPEVIDHVLTEEA